MVLFAETLSDGQMLTMQKFSSNKNSRFTKLVENKYYIQQRYFVVVNNIIQIAGLVMLVEKSIVTDVHIFDSSVVAN